MGSTETPHDQVRYPAGVFEHTHPSRLATLATLFGMRPAEVERCRVLELGCGQGSNLLPMAEALPTSTFSGIDLAPRPIAEGRARAEQLDLKNLRLEQRDILDFEPEAGTYDYIIAHGVYSWVPPAVQEKVLAIVRRGLAPEGVAQVSYNALPGGYLRKPLRDLMLFHTRGLEGPDRRVAQSRAIAAFVASGSPAASGTYKVALEGQRDRLAQLADEYLFHDDLCEHNEALYFHDFMERAGRHGLRYLAESSFADMQIQRLAPEVREVLRSIDDIVAQEQYLDFLCGRAFRRTLLVHDEVALDRRLDGHRLRPFFVVANATPATAAPDLRADAVARFEGPGGLSVGLGSPLAKAAMTALCEADPLALSFEEMLTAAREKLGHHRSEPAPTEALELGELLLALYGGDMVRLYRHRPAMVKRAGERPSARALVRAQAARGPALTSLWHGNVRVEDAALRRLLGLLDGTRDRAALGAEIGASQGEIEAMLDRLGALALLEA